MSMQEENTHFGKQLKSTRETLGLSPQEAASRLNLSPRFIHALEEEDLQQSSLPLTYLRGYLRSYSRLLNIPEIQVSKVLEQLAPAPVVMAATPTTSDVLSLSAPLSNNPYLMKAATYLVSLVLFTSVTTWWYLHTSSPTTTVIALNQPSLLNPGQSELSPQTAVNGPAGTTLARTSVSTPTTAILPANNQLALAPALSQPASKIAPQDEWDDEDTASPYEQE
jgi:cytoskeleton protein RodZ